MKFICAIDAGTQDIRAILVNQEGKIVGKCCNKTPLHTPFEGWAEHDPISYWNQCYYAIKKLISETKISPRDIISMGIANQRTSFVMFEKETGIPVSPIINWSDLRAAKKCDEINKSFFWNSVRKFSKVAYVFSRNLKLHLLSKFQFPADLTIIKLKYWLDANPEMRERGEKGNICFGTVDSWLLYNLTGYKVHSTDYGNACCTGLYDPFKLKWNKILLKKFHIPEQILPNVCDTSGYFGDTDVKYFGHTIPIYGVAGDQMAALFGETCYDSGDVKITYGSGTFVDINIGIKPIISKLGLVPILAWRFNKKNIYILEGLSAMTGTAINWALEHLKLAESPQELDRKAEMVEDIEGLYFVPSMYGLKYPYWDPYARCLLIGASLRTEDKHLCRAIIEGIGLRTADIVLNMDKELKVPIKNIFVDGGASNSNILSQFTADILQKNIIRAKEKELTALGAAFLAGLGVGFWNSTNDLKGTKEIDHIFSPKKDDKWQKRKYERWNEAVERACKWARIDPLTGRFF